MSRFKGRLKKLCDTFEQNEGIEEENLFENKDFENTNKFDNKEIIDRYFTNHLDNGNLYPEVFQEHKKETKRRSLSSNLENDEYFAEELQMANKIKGSEICDQVNEEIQSNFSMNLNGLYNFTPSETLKMNIETSPIEQESPKKIPKFKRLKKVLEYQSSEIDQTQKIVNLNDQELKPKFQDCSICLSEINSVIARLDNCSHLFCFHCIKEWSNVTNECPLCKKRFIKITKLSKEGAKIGEARVRQKNQVSQEPEYEILESKIFNNSK